MSYQKSLYRLSLLSCTCLLITHSSVLSPLVKADISKKSSVSQILTLPNRGAPGKLDLVGWVERSETQQSFI